MDAREVGCGLSTKLMVRLEMSRFNEWPGGKGTFGKGVKILKYHAIGDALVSRIKWGKKPAHFWKDL